MMMDVEQIAAGLSEAQRELVNGCCQEGRNASPMWHSPVRALITKGVLADADNLSPLGLAVRAHLEQTTRILARAKSQPANAATLKNLAGEVASIRETNSD